MTPQIYVVDSADPGRLEESRVQLDELLVEDKLTGVPLLVFANKQDLGMALKADDVSVLFQLRVDLSYMTDVPIRIV